MICVTKFIFPVKVIIESVYRNTFTQISTNVTQLSATKNYV